MKEVKYFIFSIICIFSCSIVFADNEVVIKSITPVYDDGSSIVVTNENNNHTVTFNDKNQIVKYNVIIENTSGYKLTVDEIDLTKPTEDFLVYELEGISKGDVLKSNETKEFVIFLETIEIEGWGNEFNDELLTTLNFEKNVVNPFTSTKGLIVVLFMAVIVTGASIIIYKRNKVSRYVALVIVCFSIVPMVKAQDKVVLEIKINAIYDLPQSEIDDGKITLSSLDDIAYENLTYRDLFINNNQIEGLNFINENDLTNLGDWTKEGTGANPTIDTTNYVSSPSSMRIDATSSSQFRRRETIKRDHTYYYAAKVSVERYVKGYFGIGLGSPESEDYLDATVQSKTDGFVTVSNKYTHKNVSWSFFIGSMSSANLTGNIDSIVLVDLNGLNLQNIPTESQLDTLYEEFIKLYNGEVVEKDKDDSTIDSTPDNEETTVDETTARKTFYNALKTKTQDINMKYESNFANASGLDKGGSLVTIQDLVQLGIFAQSNETISEIWGSPNYTLKNLQNGSTQTITSTVVSGTYSSNLSNYYNILGGKTGSTSVYNLVIVVENKETKTKFVGAVSSDTQDSSSNNRFSNAKILFDIATRLDENRNADISDLEQLLKSDRASVCILPENPKQFLTNDLFESEYHLYTKGANDVFRYASTQKVLSILTALDYITDLEEKITIVESDIQTGSGPTLVVGAQYTIEDVLYGMLLPSSNTFAEVLARVVGTKIYLTNN